MALIILENGISCYTYTSSLIKNVEVSSNWSGNKNNSVKVTFKENLKIVGWKITTSADEPDAFNNVKIKASGGISTYKQAEELIRAGASRLGTSKSLQLIDDEYE